MEQDGDEGPLPRAVRAAVALVAAVSFGFGLGLTAQGAQDAWRALAAPSAAARAGAAARAPGHAETLGAETLGALLRGVEAGSPLTPDAARDIVRRAEEAVDAYNRKILRQAVQIFTISRGRPPTSLDELVPGFLDELPRFFHAPEVPPGAPEPPPGVPDLPPGGPEPQGPPPEPAGPPPGPPAKGGGWRTPPGQGS